VKSRDAMPRFQAWQENRSRVSLLWGAQAAKKCLIDLCAGIDGDTGESKQIITHT